MRVALIDDSRLSRAGLRAILESQLNLSVVAEGEAHDATSLIATTHPELAIFCSPSHKDVIQPLAQLKRVRKIPATLVITECVSEVGVRHLLTLGASGILLQETAHLHLSWALPAALHGGCALSPEISRKVITEYTAPVIESTQKKAAQEKICALTARELEVLELLSQGLPNQTIANSLTITPGTVKDHVRSVFAKLNVDNRLHAARIAWQARKFDASTRDRK
ncbi:hypothetical protein C6Y14_37860 [Streptomyces dioscori]|uniref:HTH luxR-type domain-containing protein n=1 Tax=Streptomyces dioscori TaxID=2109333 RepID=A0A2P8PVU0_9ACTN|nr:hypothetical protein C6Y14_37860 [Streptomyces dioscori]